MNDIEILLEFLKKIAHIRLFERDLDYEEIKLRDQCIVVVLQKLLNSGETYFRYTYEILEVVVSLLI